RSSTRCTRTTPAARPARPSAGDSKQYATASPRSRQSSPHSWTSSTRRCGTATRARASSESEHTDPEQRNPEQRLERRFEPAVSVLRVGRCSGVFAGVDEALGDVAELDVEILRCVAQDLEGLFSGDPFSLHENALRLADDAPRRERLVEMALATGRVLG